MAARRQVGWWLGAVLVGIVLGGCQPTSTLRRIVLLAPFEGRFSEVGYNAYYAVLMALDETDAHTIELMAVDDGGTVMSATERARAIADDPLVSTVLALGEAASSAEVQDALDGVAMVVVGQWDTEPVTDSTFILASPPDVLRADAVLLTTDNLWSAITETGLVRGGDALALEQFQMLGDETTRLEVVSNSTPADAAFRERYQSMGLFTPEPNLLATLVYDAAQMALLAAHAPDPVAALGTMRYEGINGTLTFSDDYWLNAPLHTYRQDADGVWVPAAPL
jgi:hypothetical protein